MKARSLSLLKKGFTLVEVLVVLVVIAILVIGAVPFVGRAQADARDDRREADIAVIRAAIESYYLQNGEYPTGGKSETMFWASTGSGGWWELENQLVPKYLKELPSDPSGDYGTGARYGGLAYDYYANADFMRKYCNAEPYQMYVLIFRYENRSQESSEKGTCTGVPIGTFGQSGYRVIRDNT